MVEVVDEEYGGHADAECEIGGVWSVAAIEAVCDGLTMGIGFGHIGVSGPSRCAITAGGKERLDYVDYAAV